MNRVLTRNDVEAACLGGAVLGGGGGGWRNDGRRMGELAVTMGTPRLTGLSELADTDVVLTVSAVGAPAATDRYLEPVDYLRAVQLLMEVMDLRPSALITNENGGAATLNGWLQAACLGIPVLDAPCNGRAHPTGIMGSMGLHLVPSYVSVQTAVGGDTRLDKRLEVVARGGLAAASMLVRQAAVQTGGLVAVARNPVQARYVREHGAPGAISQAIGLGQAMLDAPAAKRTQAAAAFLGGKVVARGVVTSFVLETRGGFDIGRLGLSGDGEAFTLTFWNEYMTLDGHSRLATFPDLIMTFDPEGLPVTSAELREGREVQVLTVPASRLILGSGMRDKALFVVAEEAVGKTIIPYAFAE
ncbi:MAG: DUF917 family protein [Chloroflexota bacterium]|nr:DUF917 family protein [Chloroflexota bacterium]